jgi:hypothetical protein
VSYDFVREAIVAARKHLADERKRVIVIWISTQAGADGEGAFVPRQELEMASGCGHSKVAVLLRELEADGWLSRRWLYRGGRRSGCKFRLHLSSASRSQTADETFRPPSWTKPSSAPRSQTVDETASAPRSQTVDRFKNTVELSREHTPQTPRVSSTCPKPSARPSTDAQLTAVSVPRVQREERPGFPDIADYGDDIPGYAIAQARWCLAHSTDPGEVERSTAILARQEGSAA